LGVRDAKVIADTEIRIRGEAERLGRSCRADFSASCISHEPVIDRTHSGR